MKYESNICTAIIKVHENQVMQKILWEFSIFKVSELFTLLKSADILHSKSQLTTKSYLNIEGIDLFVKILVFVKILG